MSDPFSASRADNLIDLGPSKPVKSTRRPAHLTLNADTGAVVHRAGSQLSLDNQSVTPTRGGSPISAVSDEQTSTPTDSTVFRSVVHF